jgi:hypothetical protein
VPTTIEAPVTLTCSECGDPFTLSARRARGWRDRDPVCGDCRSAGRELTEAERAELRDWWLARFTFDELLEIGGLIWPELAETLYRRLFGHALTG